MNTEILKNELLKNIMVYIKNKGIKIAFIPKIKGINYQGRYSGRKKMKKIKLCLPLIERDAIWQYKRCGCILYDIDEPSTHIPFKNNNENNIILFSVINVLLHEYKHYLQDIDGKLNTEKNIDLLEDEANMYSYPITKKLYSDYINKKNIDLKAIL